jgi:hypothetical protein
LLPSALQPSSRSSDKFFGHGDPNLNSLREGKEKGRGGKKKKRRGKEKERKEDDIVLACRQGL